MGLTPNGLKRVRATTTIAVTVGAALPIEAIDFAANTATLNGSATTIAALLTTVRADARNAMGANKLFSSVAANQPRYASDPWTGVRQGLLIEPAGSNIFAQSRAFDDAGFWGKSRATVSANTTEITDCFGTNLADKLTEDTATGSHQATHSETISLGADTAYEYWVVAKAGAGGRLLRLQIQPNSGSFYQQVFDLATGVPTQASGSAGSRYCQVIPIGNGEFLCYISCVVAQAATSISYAVTMMSSDTVSSYAGDGASSLYIDQAQSRQGAMLEAPIVTAGSVGTAAADLCTRPVAWWNPAAGCSVLLDALPPMMPTDCVVWQLDDGTTSNFIRLYRASGRQRLLIVAGGVTIADIDLGNWCPGTAVARTPDGGIPSRVLMAFSSGQVRVSRNGRPDLVTSCALPASLTTERFGATTTGPTAPVTIRQRMIYASAISSSLTPGLSARASEAFITLLGDSQYENTYTSAPAVQNRMTPLLARSFTPRRRTFNRGIGGEVSTATAARWNPADWRDGLAIDHDCGVIGVFTGYNNNGQVDQVIADHLGIEAACLSQQKRVYHIELVKGPGQGVGTQAYTDMNVINAGFRSNFPGRTIDLSAALLAAATSPGDDADVAAGVVPTSLRATTDIHRNTAGIAVQAALEAAFIAGKGW